MFIKDYNSKFEKLDTSAFSNLLSSKRNKEDLPKQITLPFKKSIFLMQQTGKGRYVYEDKDSFGNVISKFDLDITPTGGGIYYKEKIDDLFNYWETYYQNGNIRSKGVSSWLGFGINKRYNYDKEGNLIDTIDFDEGYDFDYQKVLDFCRDYNIDILTERELSFPSRITKVNLENGKKVWNINYHNPETNKIDFYQLDGSTGKVVLKELGKPLPKFKHDISKPDN